MTKLDENVEVRPSGIHGRGLYALRDFRPGEVVLRWNVAHKISNDALKSLSDDERRYVHPFSDDESIIVQPPERFVNHSCDNNTVVVNFSDVAIRSISVDDEITSDYGSDGADTSFSCSCGSLNCRGKVGARF